MELTREACIFGWLAVTKRDLMSTAAVTMQGHRHEVPPKLNVFLAYAANSHCKVLLSIIVDFT